MRLPLLFAASGLLVLAGSSAAHAGFTIGASLGLAQDEANAADDPNDTLGLYGRIGILPQLSAQLELARIDSGDNGDNGVTDMRTATALAVLDLGSLAGKRLVPILLAGGGVDWTSSQDASALYHHFEAGLGLEYRATGGFVIGVDARLGTRSLDSQSSTAVPVANPAQVAFVASNLSEGEYRSVRMTIGVSF